MSQVYKVVRDGPKSRVVADFYIPEKHDRLLQRKELFATITEARSRLIQYLDEHRRGFNGSIREARRLTRGKVQLELA